MRWFPLLLLLPLPFGSCREGEEASPRQDLMEDYPLSAWCAACHAREFAAWQGSHHAQAWRKPNASLDDAPFNLSERGAAANMLYSANGKASMVFRGMNAQRLCIDARSLTGADEASGHPPFKVVAAMGCTPLVQYVVEGERGALQCTTAAWDVLRHEWFDTVPEGADARRPGDWGHWLGRGMTWNSQCASCHVSGFEKHYDAGADSYDSRWLEPGVSCIQCHSLADAPTAANGRPIRRNKGRKVTLREQADSCATCHARREELRPGFREGDAFEDFYRLELPLVEGVFWPNGAQRDECYTETGMRLSPMGKAGVTCLHCHDAHSGELRLPVEHNELCLSCHGRAGQQVNGTPVPQVQLTNHSLCPPGSEGGRCISCHMPETRYMGRDARRDHAFTSPDPQLSSELGMPNACTQCHADKDDAWAAAGVEALFGPSPAMAKYRPRTRAVAAAMRGEGHTADLLAVYRAEENPTWRATLLELLARQEPCAEIAAEAQQAATSTEPLLRAAAARILGAAAPELLDDPIRHVRYAAAWAQLDSLLAAPAPPPALAELEETLEHQSDHPAGQMQLASLAEARARHARATGDEAAAARMEAEASAHYRRALTLDPASAAARMDYAVFLARCARPLEALEQMLACTAAHPQDAEAQYRLGLILFELGHIEPARRALLKASELSPHHTRAHRALQELQPTSQP